MSKCKSRIQQECQRAETYHPAHPLGIADGGPFEEAVEGTKKPSQHAIQETCQQIALVMMTFEQQCAKGGRQSK